MAMKKRPEPRKEKNDDTVVYRAGAAMLIACAVFMGLKAVERTYPLTENFLPMRAAMLWAAGVFALIAAAGLAGLLWLREKNRFWQAVSAPCLAVGAALALSCLLLYNTWYRHIPLLLFLCVAVTVLYLIRLLYQPEFFLLSIVNVCAGSVFYGLSRLDGGSPAPDDHRILILRLGLIAVILVCALLVFLAERKGGRLGVSGLSWRAVSRGGTPMLIYVAGAVWLVCLVASVFLGPVLSYYCIFAAVAFELAAAVYYTMKLA